MAAGKYSVKNAPANNQRLQMYSMQPGTNLFTLIAAETLSFRKFRKACFEGSDEQRRSLPAVDSLATEQDELSKETASRSL